MQKITLQSPDDWHCHLREGKYLSRTVQDSSRIFKRGIIMPNLTPPVTTAVHALDYYNRIIEHIKDNSGFSPLMTLYLTDEMDPYEIKRAKDCDSIYACKLYPQGATTHSDSGVNDITHIYPLLEAMQDLELPLLIHGEVTGDVDIFDRERVFVDTVLSPLLRDFPTLKMVLEHISTEYAADFVREGPAQLAATITPQHLLLNRNAILAGGIKPHYYCLPILKRESDREALLEAATSGNPKFFLGTDSAPHPVGAKQSACGCAGIYTAFHAISLYLEAFESENALDKFEAFASKNGPAFYGLPENTDTVTYIKKPWVVPEQLEFGDSTVIPLFAGHTLQWQLAS